VLKKILKYLLFIFVLISLILFIIIEILGNFYQVNDNLFRSGQLNKYNLNYYAKKHNIKTILNLRGKSTKEVYLDEIKISNELNITHINYKISNRVFLDFNKTSEIIDILKNAKKPLLVHCAGGADRTSLVAALYQYEIQNKSVKESKKEFSLLYGHSVYFRKFVIAMDNSFDNYVNNKELINKKKEIKLKTSH